MPAKAWVDRHQQHHVNTVEGVVEIAERRGRVEDQTGLEAGAARERERSIDVIAGLGVKGNPVGPGFGKGLDQRIHRAHHQMHVHRGLNAGLAQRRKHHGSHRQIWHVVVVHHIEMDHVGTRGEHRFNLRTEACEICGENRWGDEWRLLHIGGVLAVNRCMRKRARIVANAPVASVRRARAGWLGALLCSLVCISPLAAGADPLDARLARLAAGFAAGVPDAQVMAAGDPNLGPLLRVPAAASQPQRGTFLLVGPAAEPALTHPLVRDWLVQLPKLGWSVWLVQADTRSAPYQRYVERLDFALEELDPDAGALVIGFMQAPVGPVLATLEGAFARLDLRARPGFRVGEMGLSGIVLLGTAAADRDVGSDGEAIGAALGALDLPILWVQSSRYAGTVTEACLRAIERTQSNSRNLVRSPMPFLTRQPRALADGVSARLAGFLFALTDPAARERAFAAD